MKKIFLASLVLVIISSGVITYIFISNDHSECDTKKEVSYGANGEKITKETHICKEKFSL
ncbi:hypothetical protein [uncultured Psychroserpens sp.]|uniref:hypothetical protein n=1 Tax=uncultured Psychroserpens sp. TaxID=255436 RepID=UPI00261A2E75|nr:hypothetical protein [uncultured Psychroserpens sp.]